MSMAKFTKAGEEEEKEEEEQEEEEEDLLVFYFGHLLPRRFCIKM